MSRKNALLMGFAAALLMSMPLACSFFGRNPIASQLSLVTAVRRELRLLVSTNGTIEPVDRAIIYAPTDGFVTDLKKLEGAEVVQGEILMRVESEQVMTALAQARAGLTQAQVQALPVLSGPTKEELAAADAAITENDLQLNQKRADVQAEEALLAKEAVPRQAVENLKKELSLLQLRGENLQEKKQALLARFSTDQKRLEQARVSEVTKQVELLEEQVKAGVIRAPRSGVLYSLAVKSGTFVNRGQQLADVYEPGRVRLRAYVDEPDLGGIAKGQPVVVEWDGLQDRRWSGIVERPADQVVALGNRSVGHVVCAIEGEAKELIPNINVKVQIVTATRANTLVIPRSCVHSYRGQPTVLLWDGNNATRKPVRIGLITPQDVEVLQGIDEGSVVIANPGVLSAQ